MEFKKIIFEYLDKTDDIYLNELYYKLIVTPVNLYKIIDQDRIVIIYNFKLELTKSVTSIPTDFKFIECNIPYYISNGETNKFNCDILLPFFCFHEKKFNEYDPISRKLPTRINSGCPIINSDAYYTTNGLLLKNNIIENINLSKINMKVFNEWLTNNIYKLDIITKNELIKLLLNKSIVAYKVLFNNNDLATEHLYSFLPRINNLINIILSLQTSKLDILTDYNELKPSTDNMRSKKISQEQFEKLSSLQLDMETKLSIINKYENRTFTIDPTDPIDQDILEKYENYQIFDDIRLKIYDTLIDIKTKLYEHIVTESISLEVIDISIHDFNNLDDIQICNTTNILNINTINNYNKYSLISQHFLYILMKKLHDTENIEGFTFLNSILNVRMTGMDEYYNNIPSTFDHYDNTFDHCDITNNSLIINQLERWSAQVCKNSDTLMSNKIYNKYLKYKKKYLNLKLFSSKK